MSNLKQMTRHELISYRDDLKEFLDQSTQQAYRDACTEVYERMRVGEEAIKIVNTIYELRKHEMWPDNLDKCIEVLLINWRKNYDT